MVAGLGRAMWRFGSHKFFVGRVAVEGWGEVVPMDANGEDGNHGGRENFFPVQFHRSGVLPVKRIRAGGRLFRRFRCFRRLAGYLTGDIGLW
jgi:hypothetical protein